jgi:hypothetical protein
MRILVPALAIAAVAAPASAADRNFTITGFTKIRVDGPYQVTLTTDKAPFARASGDSSALNGVAIEVQGSTLVIHPDRSSWGGFPGDAHKPARIFLGTHELTAAWVNGAGSLAISRARGLSFDLALDGPGSVSIATMDVDQLRVRLAGAAVATLAGRAARVTAQLQGSSTLDAGSLAAKDALVTAEGPASAKLAVANSAKVEASGTAAVQLSGKPACTTRIYGSASVSGCK